jgi:glutathione S-transferase
MLELYYFEAATCGRKVRLQLAEKGIDYIQRLLDRDAGDLTTPEYRALNPNGYVPTLVHDGHVVTESTVIMNYIEDVHPAPPLRPDDPLARARMNIWLKWADEKYLAALGLLTYAVSIRKKILKKGVAGDRCLEALGTLDRMLADMETSLGGGQWLAGDAVSLADCAIVPFVWRLDELGFQELWTRSRPNVDDWWRRIQERPSFDTVIIRNIDAGQLASLRADGAEAWGTLRDRLAAA